MKCLKSYKNVVCLLKYVCKFAPEMAAIKFFMIFVDVGLNCGFNVALVKIILDSIADGSPFQEVLFYIFLYSILLIVSLTMDTVYYDYIRDKACRKIHKGMHLLLFNKIRHVDLEKYDDEEFYNDFIWALERCDNQVISCFDNFMKLLTNLLLCVSYVALIIYIDFWLVLFVVIPILTNLVVGHFQNQVSYRYDVERNSIERRENYSKRIFYLKEYAKEIKSSKIGEVLTEDFKTNVDNEIDLLKRYKNKIIPLKLLMGGGTDVIQVAVLYI